MSRRQNAVDVPFLKGTSSIIHVTSKSSKTLNRQGFRDIGLKSPSVLGNWVSGIVVTFVSSQIEGTIPVKGNALKVVLTGSAYS